MITRGLELLTLVERRGATVVSIDLFDTLVYRTVVRPVEVFKLQYHASKKIVDLCGSVERWTSLRVTSEHYLLGRMTFGEVSLEEIYQEIAKRLNLEIGLTRKLMHLELTIERRMVRPYLDVVSALEALAGRNLTIVVTTDTCLPERVIRSMLGDILSFKPRLFCSSSTGKTKRSGAAYDMLKEVFPCESLIHFGDNFWVDEVAARRRGVVGYQTYWPRQRWLKENGARVNYLNSSGNVSIVTPRDDDASRNVANPARDEVAWRWSTTVVDFLVQLKDCAEEIEADEIWFMSRDCETMFKALSEAPAFLAAFSVRYVICSRATFYPVIAEQHSEKFRAWVGRDPTPKDIHDGRLARNYYQNLLGKGAKKVLIVDVGWKGRLQFALQSIAPPGAILHGYYFSLEPMAEASTIAHSAQFMPWERSILHQAAIECLFGFCEDSCERFLEAEDGLIVPVFRSNIDDRAPADYCASLATYLAFFLKNIVPLSPGPLDKQRERLRRSAVVSTCAFPDAVTADCFEGWSIGTSLDGSNAAKLIRERKNWRTRLLSGLTLGLSGWPAGDVWSVTSQPHLVRLLQTQMRARATLRRRLKKLIGREN